MLKVNCVFMTLSWLEISFLIDGLLGRLRRRPVARRREHEGVAAGGGGRSTGMHVAVTIVVVV